MNTFVDAAMYICLSVLTILVIGTVNHPNMNFSDEKTYISRNRARFVVVLRCIYIYIGSIIGIKGEIIVFPCFGIILCEVLQILAKIAEKEVTNGL